MNSILPPIAFFFLVFFFALAPNGNSQKMLLLQQVKKDAPRKFYLGDEMTYQLRDDKIWRTGTIMDLDFDQQLILFSNGNVHIDEVGAFRFYDVQRIGNAASLSLATFSGGWGLFALGDEIAGGDNDWRFNANVIASSAAISGIIWLATRRRTKKMNRKRRLVITDLSLN